MITIPTKLVAEVWNVGLDFAQQLQAGETITSVGVLIVTGSATAVYGNLSGTVATITVAGGLSGQLTVVQIAVTTSAGEVLAERLNINVI